MKRLVSIIPLLALLISPAFGYEYPYDRTGLPLPGTKEWTEWSAHPPANYPYKMQSSKDPESPTDAILWSRLPRCPDAGFRIAGASDGTYLYVMFASIMRKYDAVADNWLTCANPPDGCDNGGACYSAHYNKIYLFGGYNGGQMTAVQVYNVATNSWTKTSDLVYAGYGYAAVALDSFVYLMGGSGNPGFFYRYYPPTRTYTTLKRNMLVSSHGSLIVKDGYIYNLGGWPDNNTLTRYDVALDTWVQLTSIPLGQGRHGCGLDTLRDRIYTYGGGAWWHYPTANCWAYNPGTNAWTYEGPMQDNHIGGAFGAVNMPDSSRQLHATCGSDSTVSGTDPHEATFIAPANYRDIAAHRIYAPILTVDSGVVITPRCSLYNYGSVDPSPYKVRMSIGSTYLESLTIVGHAPMDFKMVTFPNWTASPMGRHATKCSVDVTGDRRPENDACTSSVFVANRDVGVSQIRAPIGNLDSGDAVTPSCVVTNYAAATYNFVVRCKIGSAYNQTVFIASLGAGASQTVNFPGWTARPRNWVAVTCTTEMVGDANPFNDRMRDSVFVEVRDIACRAIVEPMRYVALGSVITPRCTVWNYGNVTGGQWVRMYIGTGYNQRVNAGNIPPDSFKVITFNNWTATPIGNYWVRCTTIWQNQEMVARNDRKTDTCHVIAGIHDVGATRIMIPTGTIDSGTVITPVCSVYNYGAFSEAYTIRLKIGTLYDWTAQVTGHNPGTRQAVTFMPWTAQPIGNVAVSCSTELTTDAQRTNDKATGTVFVQLSDVQTVNIIQPSGNVNSGQVVTPQATVRNDGNTVRTFTVKFDIADGYTNTQTITNLGAGASTVVNFTNWTAGASGTYETKCSTQLAGDQYPDNDKVTGSVTVVGLDAQTVAILAPTGNVNQGAAITPQASVRNNGSTTLIFPVKFDIAPAYTSTQTCTLTAGQTRTLSFASWTADPLGALAVKCSTQFSSDVNPANDKVAGSVYVQNLDVATVTVLAPAGNVNLGAVVAPQARLTNYGNVTVIFPVKFDITPAYTSSRTCTLAAGEVKVVTFADWTAGPAGVQATKCSTQLTGDRAPNNDKATGTVLVQTLDAASLSILAPTGNVNLGTVIAPQASITNYGNSTIIFPVKFDIAAGYTSSRTCTLTTGQTKTVTFDNWTAGPLGNLAVQCSTQLLGDMVPGNDRVVGAVFVQNLDIQTTAILAPTGTVNQGTVISPQATVVNNGNTTVIFPVKFDIAPAWTSTRTCTLAASETKTVTFAAWTAGPLGTLALKCSTQLTGDLTPANDKATGSVFVQSLDAQTLTILTPTGTVDQGTVIAPTATVRNNGNTTQTFTVKFTIQGGYTDSVTITGLAAGATTTATFADWTAGPLGTLTTACSTRLAGDMLPANDRVTDSVFVRNLDVQTLAIIGPTGNVNQGTVIAPSATVRNNGNTARTFTVKFTIAGGYADSVTVTNLAAGATTTATFADWTAAPLGNLVTACSTRLAGDMTPANDKATGSVFVQNLDVQTLAIIGPTGTVNQGFVMAPSATVRNNGNLPLTFTVRFDISDGYANTQTVTSLAAGATTTVTFGNWTASTPGNLATKCSTQLTGDVTPANDKVVGTVFVRSLDVQTVTIVGPTGTVNQGTTMTPSATVRNNGNATQTFTVKFDISDGYTNTQTITDLAAGATTTVTFADWTADTLGNLTTKCSTQLAGDMLPANDKVTGTVYVRNLDAQTVSIIAPTGTVDLGTMLTPQASVRNNGNQTAIFPVRFDIGVGYTSTRTCTLTAGQTLTVSFTPWLAGPVGTMGTKCSTQLAGDFNPANDKLTGTIFVRNLDVRTVTIIDPSGVIGQGTVVTPQAEVANTGSQAATFTVKFDISDGYTSTQAITNLPAGDTAVVTFADWTANTPGSLVTACSTRLTGDMMPANDKVTGSIAVVSNDVEALAIVVPTGAIDSGATIAPQARVRNNGNSTVSFDVRFTIGTGYTDNRTVADLAPNATQLVTFTDWTATTRGTFALRCTVALPGDMIPANNVLTGSVAVNVHDLAAIAIVQPTGVITPGPIAPQATVRNLGTTRQAADVWFHINSTIPYAQSVTLTNGLPVGIDTTLVFPDWTAVAGTYITLCSTFLAGDQQPANNVVTDSVLVGQLDVGVAYILTPTGTHDSSVAITPSAIVRNYGSYPTGFRTCFRILDATRTVVYQHALDVAELAPGESALTTFNTWVKPHLPGTYETRCSTYLAGDVNAANDLVYGSFVITDIVRERGWVRKADVPLGARSKRVRDGGCLVYRPTADSEYVYGLKGNSTFEFYAYNIATNAWDTRESIPAFGNSGRKKTVKKGATLSRSGDQLYATKGNNSLEFWRYSPPVTAAGVSDHAYSWSQLADVPLGARTVREGAGAVAVTLGGVDYIYFLKGSGTNEFYRYRVLDGFWERMASAPLGFSGKYYKNGSCLALSEDGSTVYALKAVYNEFYSYSVDSDKWTTLSPLPFIGLQGRKKKAKDGAGLAYHNQTVYALKGNNTQEFWSFACTSSTWSQLEDMPIGGGKRVKGGGALAFADRQAALYANKGNNTVEFWRYGLAADLVPLAAGSSTAGQSSLINHQSSILNLSITPNPSSFRNPHSAIRIDYTLPAPGDVTLKLYDITGKLVTTTAQGQRPAGVHSTSIRNPQSAFRIPSGVYILKLESGSNSTSARLVIE